MNFPVPEVRAKQRTIEMIFDIDSMPLGGPEAASWLGRRLQTDRLDYLYGNDVHHLKRGVGRAPRRGL